MSHTSKKNKKVLESGDKRYSLYLLTSPRQASQDGYPLTSPHVKHPSSVIVLSRTRDRIQNVRQNGLCGHRRCHHCGIFRHHRDDNLRGSNILSHSIGRQRQVILFPLHISLNFLPAPLLPPAGQIRLLRRHIRRIRKSSCLAYLVLFNHFRQRSVKTLRVNRINRDHRYLKH